MNRSFTLIVVGLLAVAGCNETKPTAGGVKPAAADSDVTANLEKLTPDDRALAQSQKLCPVTDEPLGSMGVPIKLTVKDQPVFICCKACEKSAQKDPDKTLQKVAELKNKAAGGAAK